jgi:hypothetical protein
MSSVQFVLLFDALLLGMSGLMASQGRTVAALSLLGAFGLFAIWQIVLASISNSFDRTYRWEPFLKGTHYVQAAMHMTMLAYLGLYWVGVPRYAPLIAAQIVFGYLCDMLLAWSRGRVWRAGFGVFPIVLSTNLFMWFREPVFYLQLLLILITFLGKEFVTWNYGGRRRHIVNPSALSLSIASILLLTTQTVNLSHAVDISAAFDVPPNFYELIFLLGLVVQYLFVVTPTTFGAGLSMYLIFLATPLLTGQALAPTPIHSAVFLGMTFLVTDPATSPRTYFGRFLFGLAYGIGVTISFVVLRLIHEPAIFDKLLIVPIVNLLVPWINRLAEWPAKMISGTVPQESARPTFFARTGWLAAYIGLFAIMLPGLKSPHWSQPSLLPTPVGDLSDDVKTAIQGMIICRTEFPRAFKPFGFSAEFANYSAMWPIYRTGKPPAAPGQRLAGQAAANSAHAVIVERGDPFQQRPQLLLQAGQCPSGVRQLP